MRIPWADKATKAHYEDMVSVLVKRLHPTAERIDGSGGDGGRDVQVHTDDGLAIYELKSFTGRLSEGDRKRQISRSLRKAAAHGPINWFLVVPIDPTPSELTWFHKMLSDHAVPGEWLGATWLDSEMALRPDIPRYFLEGYKSEVVKLLRELRHEDFALDDGRQAIYRARAIRKQLNEADPYFEYALTIGSGAASHHPYAALSVTMGNDRIDVIPRYRTALRDRPINIIAELEFDKEDGTHREAFERALKFGDSVTLPSHVVRRLKLDAPAGLSHDVAGAEMCLGAPEIPLDDVQLVHVAVIAPDRQTRLAVQEFEVTHRRAGSGGGTLTGKDITGLLSVRIRMDHETRHMRINVSSQQVPVLPSAGLAVAEWLDEVRPPNLLALDFVGLGGSSEQVAIDKPMIDGPITPFFEAFLKLQQQAGVSFPVPVDVTGEEWSAVSQVVAWLSPEKLQYTWTDQEMTITPSNEQALRDVFRPEGGTLMIGMDVSLEFRGRQLQLGRLARAFQARAVGGQQALDKALQRGEKEMQLHLEPAGHNIAYEWLMDYDEAQPSDSGAGHEDSPG